VLLLWVVPVLIEAVGSLDIELERPYLAIFALVAFDAVIPVFPSESVLHVASALAAQGELTLGYVVLAGGVGVVVGDSLLCWISRSIARSTFAEKLERARKNERVEVAFEVFDRSAPLLIVLGRFVVGVRFAVTATMGVTRYPYPRFLHLQHDRRLCLGRLHVRDFLLDERGAGRRLVSIATGVLLTTVILAVLYVLLKRSSERREKTSGSAVPRVRA